MFNDSYADYRNLMESRGSIPVAHQTLTGSGAILFGEDPGAIMDERSMDMLHREDKNEYLAREYWIRQLSQ